MGSALCTEEVDGLDTVKGYVEHIIFRNEENGYTVLNLVTEGQELTCVGTFSYIGEGELLEASGTLKEHPMYGEQLLIEFYELKTPEDEVAMERYLGSGAIKGIGSALAARIVRHFKGETFRIIEEEPERLAEIKGISEKKAREIAAQLEEKKDMRKAMMFLQQYGVSNNMAVKLYGKYGDEIYRVLQENPYRLADEVNGIGFRAADEIARRAGIAADSDFRIRSAITYMLLLASGQGHTCLPVDILKRNVQEILGMDVEDFDQYLMDLLMDRKIIRKEKDGVVKIYASNYYYLEMDTARMLFDLRVRYDVSEAALDHRIASSEENTGMKLDEMQQEAVREAARQGLLVITGGPGTGKTTTINAIIRYLESEGLDIRLAAPTGRAAKRMTEATGCEAQTIHRLLELSGGPDSEGGTQAASFERNEQNPLETDAVIIDEMSMVDIHIMHALLKALIPGTRLIMVGDVNQLPSVGPGCVLKDIIRSEAFPVLRLTKIFRQASKSDIIVNAHRIHRGEQVPLDNKSMDFFFLKRYDANIIIRVLLALIQEKLPKFVDAKPFDIQVLTPMRKGVLGVERLNSVLQQYLNPPSPEKKEKEHAGGLFREGDKVMQIRNNYQIEWEVRSRYGILSDSGTGVFNGDMGIVKEILPFSEQMTVEFDEGRCVTYSFKQLDELELAYAITIHKAQGSEYPAVLLPLLTGPRQLFNRNLLYTAVTRARKCVTVVGSPETFAQMIENENEQKRYSGLLDRIEEFREGKY